MRPTFSKEKTKRLNFCLVECVKFLDHYYNSNVRIGHFGADSCRATPFGRPAVVWRH